LRRAIIRDVTAGSVEVLVREGREAYQRGDAAGSRLAFEQAVAESDSGEVLEGLAKAIHLALDYRAAMEVYERAYRAYRQEGNLLAAARAARTIGWFRGWLYGDWAVSHGWMARARSLLEPAGESGNEHGWILVARAHAGNDLDEQKRLFLEAIEIARRYRDSDLECEALSYLGVMLVLSGHADEGLGYLDEALAAVCGGDVEELYVVEGTFCALFHTCERTHDVGRAEQWLRAADDLVQRRGFTAIGGYCRAHYGGILTAAGRWAEAEAELMAAVRTFAPDQGRIRGSVLCRLADLRLRQGRLEEAAELLAGLDQHEDAVRPLAALYLARSETARAQDLLERTLAAGGLEDAVEGPLLALLLEAHLTSGALDEARRVATRLSDIAAKQSGDYLKALAALASGRLCITAGTGDARACLHEALAAFARAQMPVDLARTRLELARALAPDRPEVAAAEAGAALQSLQRLAAHRDADAAAALLRSLGAPSGTGPKGRALLTKREEEVLELLGHGLTNAQIGDRLFISPKTVEHHVGRILGKLGLRSRAQAVAHAVRTVSGEPAGK
jgi:DNA-binding NarL/FixJ family response regulator